MPVLPCVCVSLFYAINTGPTRSWGRLGIASALSVKTTTPGSWLFVVLFYWCLFTSDFSDSFVNLNNLCSAFPFVPLVIASKCLSGLHLCSVCPQAPGRPYYSDAGSCHGASAAGGRDSWPLHQGRSHRSSYLSPPWSSALVRATS